MKQRYTFSYVAAWIAMLLVGLCALPSRVAAQTTISFQEDFDYPLGNLYKQGGWMRYGSNEVAPIQVVDKVLTYEGYSDGTKGKSVKLGNIKSAEDLHARFTDNDEGIKTGSIYMSALINVESQPSKDCYVLALEPRTRSSVVAEGTNPTELGRVYIGKSENADEFKIGVERGGAKPVYSKESYKLGQTYLVVLHYEIKAEQKDNVYLYVNPASLKVEPTTASAMIDGTNWTGSAIKSQGMQGVELRQGTNATITAPELYVSALRVSDSYAGLFGGKSEDKTPKLNVAKKSLVLGSTYADDIYNETITVTGANLKGDVSVESSSANITVSPTSLAQADVESGDGAKLNIRIKYTEGEQKETITLKSEGVKDVVINVSWTGCRVNDIASIDALYKENPDDGLTYRYTGEAVITFIDKTDDKNTYYLQDATGAIAVADDYNIVTAKHNVGDKVTGTILGLQETFGTLLGIAFNTHVGNLISTGNTVEPTEATIAELEAAPKNYVQKLVRVSGVKFKDVADGATFANGMAQPIITDGTKEAKVRIFKNTTLIGKPIPTSEVTLTGLFTSAKALIIAPRGIEDIAEQTTGTPSLEATVTKAEVIAGVVGKEVTAATIHVSAKNMPATTILEITGAGKAHFALSTSEIQKGSSETDVIVTYKPTTVAKHRAYISIDCPSVPDQSKSIMLDAYAIDEQNPPSVKLNPQTFAKFSAKAGETQEQTIEITTSGMPDYGKIVVKDAGEFRLNNTMLMKNMKNTVKVTFAPKKAGTYSTQLVITALGMADVTVPIEGVATDGTAVDPTKEGDEFKLSDAKPVTMLNETFDNITERNKAFHLEGWTNSAIEGNRAWWGYSFLDTDESAGEKVAKVTAYDSNVEDGSETPVQMMLVTPALDFKNAASKMFTFRVRGDYLQDNQTDKLELVYIDLEDGEPYIAPVGGFNMPCTKDASGEWNEFHVDLTGQELADKFFMGFRFNSTRGRTNSATYYIDDVTYGRTDIAIIRPDKASLEFVAQMGKDAHSDIVTVATENLTSPLKLSIGGANKSKFKLSTTELPAEGGTFNVAFNSDVEGVHVAYVKLASRGAADKYVELAVNNTIQTGIDAITATPAHITIYDLAGNRIAERQNATPAEAVKGLAAGVYVIKTATDNSINTYKVQLP